jgi:microcompartment protein CcmL/EutN
MEAPSLGLVEIFGYVATIEAADAGCKAANVSLLGYERGRAGLFTVKFAGDVAAVRAAVTAASAAAERIGKVVAVHVIARPDRQLHVISEGEKNRPEATVKQIPVPVEVAEAKPEAKDDQSVELSQPAESIAEEPVEAPVAEKPATSDAAEEQETNVVPEPSTVTEEEKSTAAPEKNIASERPSEPSSGATASLQNRRKERAQKGKGKKKF